MAHGKRRRGAGGDAERPGGGIYRGTAECSARDGAGRACRTAVTPGGVSYDDPQWPATPAAAPDASRMARGGHPGGVRVLDVLHDDAGLTEPRIGEPGPVRIQPQADRPGARA